MKEKLGEISTEVSDKDRFDYFCNSKKKVHEEKIYRLSDGNTVKITDEIKQSYECLFDNKDSTQESHTLPNVKTNKIPRFF